MALKSLRFFAVCLMVPAIFFLHADHLQLWFDETVQLSSAYLSNPETLDAYRYEVDPGRAVYWNQRYNMDPGGYTLFLNLLSPVVGNSFHLYRIFNIVAFILGVALLTRFFCRTNAMDASFIGLLFWASVYVLALAALWGWLPFANLLQSGLSIRAYALEFLFVSALICVSDRLGRFDAGGYILIACLIFLGLGLRYDFALFVVSYLAAAAIDILRRGELKRALGFPYAWLVAAAALLGAFLIYRVSYVHQMGGIVEPMKMKYISFAYLNTLENAVSAARHPRNILAAFLYLVTLWRILKSSPSFIELVYAVLFTVNILLSFKGYYPFHLSLDRCLGIIVTFNVVLVQHLIAVFRRFRGMLTLFPKSRDSWARLFRPSIAFAAVVCSFVLVRGAVLRHGERPFMTAMTDRKEVVFDSVVSGLKGATVLMDRSATPNIKTYFHFRGRPLPPNNYICDVSGPHSRQSDPPTLEERCVTAGKVPADCYVVPELVKCAGFASNLEGSGFKLVPDSDFLYVR
jgi:hypothetical protein